MATRKSEPQYRAKPQGKAEPQAKAEPMEKAGSKDAGGLSRIFGDVANKTSLASNILPTTSWKTSALNARGERKPRKPAEIREADRREGPEGG